LGIAREKLFSTGRPLALAGRSAMQEKLFFDRIGAMSGGCAQAGEKSFS
jgi:hypothetical protein